MAMFNSYVSHYQRVYPCPSCFILHWSYGDCLLDGGPGMGHENFIIETHFMMDEHEGFDQRSSTLNFGDADFTSNR